MRKQRPISPVTRSKHDARVAYDKMSRYYDCLTRRGEKKYRNIAIKQLNPQAGEKILELGPGTGESMTEIALALGPWGRVYGVDISEGMIRKAKEKLCEENILDRTEFYRGDAMNLPYDKGYFDAVYICFTLELFDTHEIPEVLKECHRVLKDSGRLVLLSLSKKDRWSCAEAIYEWAHRQFPKYVDCRPVYPGQSLESAGFSITQEIDLSLWRLSVASILARKKD